MGCLSGSGVAEPGRLVGERGVGQLSGIIRYLNDPSYIHPLWIV